MLNNILSLTLFWFRSLFNEPLGILHIWEVATWEIVTWEVALGKVPNTLCRTHTRFTSDQKEDVTKWYLRHALPHIDSDPHQFFIFQSMLIIDECSINLDLKKRSNSCENPEKKVRFYN